MLSSNLADAAGVEGDFSAGQGVLHVRIAQLEENSVFSTLEPQLTDPQGIRKTCSLELDGFMFKGLQPISAATPGESGAKRTAKHSTTPQDFQAALKCKAQIPKSPRARGIEFRMRFNHQDLARTSP